MRPAVVFAESITRFCAGSILPDLSQAAAVNGFLQTWIGLIGPPLKLIVDTGTNSQGKRWSAISDYLSWVYLPGVIGQLGAWGDPCRFPPDAYQSTDESAGKDA